MTDVCRCLCVHAGVYAPDVIVNVGCIDVPTGQVGNSCYLSACASCLTGLLSQAQDAANNCSNQLVSF
jgi:hypothetical protein